MAKTFISLAIVITALLAVLAVSESNAICCNFDKRVVKECTGAPYEEELSMVINAFISKKLCATELCSDSKPTRDGHCGVGDCNIFNCACAGGCRQSKRERL